MAMARREMRLGMALVLLMFLSGCIYSSTPEWGTGDGQIHVDIDGDIVEIQSNLGSKEYEDTFELTGCGEGKLEVTGMLISSQVYSEHPNYDDIESAAGAAVLIHIMSWSSAESVEEGTAGRASIDDWSNPLVPSEKVGDKIFGDNVDDWEIIGIIPGSENIADGLNVLEHWHQAIELTGYALKEEGGAINEETCDLEGQGHYMVVTNIKTEQGVVSLDGEDDDEYSLGDTDIFGGWTFILFFLIAGVGGGVGLFMVSTMVIRQGARATAETLLGREGFAKALQMKKDLKKSKKEGLESPASRASQQKKSSPPPKKKSKGEDVAIPGFSLDSVLQSSSSEEGPKTFGGGGSVVVTSEAKEMQSQEPVTTSIPEISNSPMASAGVVSSQPEPERRGHFSATMSRSSATQPTKAAQPTQASKPVKRRAVKKRAAPRVEPEPEPQQPVENKRASIADDDEFSDFSF